MGALAWVMMGIAIWHFTVYVPDHFWAGIVGAFFAASIGSFVFPFIVNGFSIPGEDDTSVIQAFIAVPGALIGLGICYFIGLRREQPDEVAADA
jgi:hypothetical protein